MAPGRTCRKSTGEPTDQRTASSSGDSPAVEATRSTSRFTNAPKAYAARRASSSTARSSSTECTTRSATWAGDGGSAQA